MILNKYGTYGFRFNFIMNAKDFFNKQIETTSDLNSDYVDKAIVAIKKKFGIDTCREELLIHVRQELGVDEITQKECFKFILTIRPTQALMRKFSKDYPEILV